MLMMAMGVVVCFATAAPEPAPLQALPYVFHHQTAIEDSTNISIKPQLPLDSLQILAPDPNHPSAWVLPCGVFLTPEGIVIWYQRIDETLSQPTDRRVLCLGFYANNQLRLPALHPDPSPWGGPNNIVMRGISTDDQWGGFRNCQPLFLGDRFEMLFWDKGPDNREGAFRATSFDAKAWTAAGQAPIFSNPHGLFTILHHHNQFLLFQTITPQKSEPGPNSGISAERRVITLRSSANLEKWSEPRVILEPDSSHDATGFYLLKAFPYRDRFAGLLMQYAPDIDSAGKTGIKTYTELVSSSDLEHWDRPGRNLDIGFWTYASPFDADGFLCFVTHKERALFLTRYKPHRLFGAEPNADTEGSFTTPPLVMPADADLALDLDTTKGWVDVEILDTAGIALGGLGACRIAGIDDHNALLSWVAMTSRDLPLEAFRLRFRIQNAKVYAVTTYNTPAPSP